MNERTQNLRDIFLELAPEGTFTERQQTARGTVHTEAQVDAALEAVVEELRDRYGFRTTLSGTDLVTVVRGYYAGQSDADIAAELGDGSLTDVVARARVNLHLFRDRDTDATFDTDAFADRLEAGATAETLAAEFGVSERTVGHYKHILEKMRDARLASHRYQAEFESILAETVLEDRIGAALLTDRQTMQAVRE